MAKSRSAKRSYRKKSKKSSRPKYRKKMSAKSRRCKNLLKKKVEKNLKEYGKGRYSSRSQAIAVAYSQVKKMRPSCHSVFKGNLRSTARGRKNKN